MSKIQEQFEAYFKSKYKPAADEQEASIKLSTIDFYRKIDKSFPGLFTPDQLVDFLSEQGFKFTDMEFDFEWMVALK